MGAASCVGAKGDVADADEAVESGVAEAVVDAAADVAEDVVDAAADVAEAVVDGSRAEVYAALNAAAGVADAATDGVAAILDSLTMQLGAVCAGGPRRRRLARAAGVLVFWIVSELSPAGRSGDDRSAQSCEGAEGFDRGLGDRPVRGPRDHGACGRGRPAVGARRSLRVRRDGFAGGDIAALRGSRAGRVRQRPHPRHRAGATGAPGAARRDCPGRHRRGCRTRDGEPAGCPGGPQRQEHSQRAGVRDVRAAGRRVRRLGCAQDGESGCVHHGIFEKAGVLREAIVAALAPARADLVDVRRVVLTGHSLGAGCVTFLGAAFATWWPRVSPASTSVEVDVFAFAAPAVADAAWQVRAAWSRGRSPA